MAGHEARINDALKQLGEEFRLGMVAADEYRSRRRLLLESWGEADATTSPGLNRVGGSTTGRPPAAASPAPAAPASGRGKAGLIIAILGGLVVVAAILYFAFAPKAPPPASAAQAESAGPQVQAIKKAADDFLARNDWGAAAVGAFLEQWRKLSPEERARALDEPSLRTLRYELDQNIKAESQLVPADAPPEQRQRLDRLTRFATELGGG